MNPLIVTFNGSATPDTVQINGTPLLKCLDENFKMNAHSATPAYLPDGSCRFCHAPTRFGGAGTPHAENCPFWAALQEITSHGVLTVEVAAVMLAEAHETIGRLEDSLAEYYGVL